MEDTYFKDILDSNVATAWHKPGLASKHHLSIFSLTEPIERQPIGLEPDMKDGVRHNDGSRGEWDKVNWSISHSGLQIVVSPPPQFPPMPGWLGGVSRSHHLVILSTSKDTQERLFNLMLPKKENYTHRESRRHIKIGLYERQKISRGMFLPVVQLKSGILPYVFRIDSRRI